MSEPGGTSIVARHRFADNAVAVLQVVAGEVLELERRGSTDTQRGAQSIAHFVGAPGGANLVAPIFRGSFFAGLGSNRMYGTGTCDTMNKFRVNGDMYGSPMRLAYPDVDHTDFMMILGANPVVSGTTLYHLPKAHQRLSLIHI